MVFKIFLLSDNEQEILIVKKHLYKTISIFNINNLDIVLSLTDDESYELITCFCMKPYGGRPMIECSVCETWIHLSCAKIRKNSIPDTFVCNNCRDNRFTKRKSSRTRVENNKFVV